MGGSVLLFEDLQAFPKPPTFADVVGGWPFQDVVWEDYEPLNVSSPCAGLLASKDALESLGVPHTMTDVFDVDVRLRPALERLLSNSAELHLGGGTGDITKTDVEWDPEAHCMITGPPCPPFSALGVRGGTADPRERVFRATTRILAERLKNPKFLFGLIENVYGIYMKQKGISYAQRFARDLLEALGPEADVVVRSIMLTGRDVGIPQSRTRVWIVVMRHSLLHKAGVPEENFMKQDLGVKILQKPLRDFLNLRLPLCAPRTAK